jgi:hypothetical protein
MRSVSQRSRVIVVAGVAAAVIAGGAVAAYAAAPSSAAPSGAPAPSSAAPSGAPAPSYGNAPGNGSPPMPGPGAAGPHSPHLAGTVVSSSATTIIITDMEGFQRTIEIKSSTKFSDGLTAAVSKGTNIIASGTVDADKTSLDAATVSKMAAIPRPAGDKGGVRGPGPAGAAGGGPGKNGPGPRPSGAPASGTAG